VESRRSDERQDRVYVVLRIDGDLPVEDAVSVIGVYLTQKEARAELDRLNRLRHDPTTRYFQHATRLFRRVRTVSREPTGRDLRNLFTEPESKRPLQALLEHTFCAEVIEAAWLRYYPSVDAEVVSTSHRSSYDVELRCGTLTRQVELKSGHGRVRVSPELALLRSACVVNIEAMVVGKPSTLRLGYRYFGSAPGEPFDFSLVTRPESGPPAQLSTDAITSRVSIPLSAFTRTMSALELVTHLFGPAQSSEVKRPTFRPSA
jgi:hypothetical protein